MLNSNARALSAHCDPDVRSRSLSLPSLSTYVILIVFFFFALLVGKMPTNELNGTIMESDPGVSPVSLSRNECANGAYSPAHHGINGMLRLVLIVSIN